MKLAFKYTCFRCNTQTFLNFFVQKLSCLYYYFSRGPITIFMKNANPTIVLIHPQIYKSSSKKFVKSALELEHETRSIGKMAVASLCLTWLIMHFLLFINTTHINFHRLALCESPFPSRLAESSLVDHLALSLIRRRDPLSSSPSTKPIRFLSPSW